MWWNWSVFVFHGKPSVDREGVRDAGTGSRCRSHLLCKGNALEGSDPLSQPDQIPAAENQEDRGSGVTEQNLIWPTHGHKNTACWLSPLERIEKGRGHTWTLIGLHASATPASIVPLILWARLSLLLQSFPPLCWWHHIAHVNDVHLFCPDMLVGLRPVHVVSAQNSVCGAKKASRLKTQSQSVAAEGDVLPKLNFTASPR